MSSTWRIRKRTALVCLLAVFGLGIAAERYRQYSITNVGEVSVQRTDAEITLTVDAESFTDWHVPVTLRAGSHQFHASWREFQVKTTIKVKRGDKAPLNQVKYSLHNGQLQIEHNSHLLDVVPRPEPEVFAIQTASGKFWHTADNGEIVLRPPRETGGTELYTLHWLRLDHSEAFIQSSNGRFVTNMRSPSAGSPGVLGLSDENHWPDVFRINRVKESESWIEFGTRQHFVDVDADSKRVRTTRIQVFASPHLLIRASGKSNMLKPVPPPPALIVTQVASSVPSLRRFKGHTDVIRAVVFTPDARHIISGSSDGTIRFWNVQSGKQIHAIPAHRPVMSLAISSDGESLACGLTESVVKFWKLEHEPKIAHYSQRILSRDYRGSSGVLSIAFSPDDTRVAAGARIWNLLSPDERCMTIEGRVTSLVWSRCGERLLLDGQSLRWWPESGLKTPRRHGLGTLLIRSGDDPLIVNGGDVLDAETLQVLHSFNRRNDVRTVSAQLAAGQNLLVTGDVIINPKDDGRPDEFVSVWDLQTGRLLAVLRERFGQVGSIAISPNGEHIAYGNGIRETGYLRETTTGDYDLRVWRIINDEP